MKIGIDATSLYKRSYTGVEYYLVNLIQNLINTEDVNDYYIFYRKEMPDFLNAKKSNFHNIIINNSSQIFVEQISLPYLVRKLDLEVIHYPVFPPSFLTLIFNLHKFIITIHDLTPWIFIKTMSIKSRIYFVPRYRMSIGKAAAIITDSYNTESELKKLNPKLKNIFTIYQGIDQDFRLIKSGNKIKKILKKYNIDTRFILSVGSIEPRKNLVKLINIFIKYKEIFNIKNLDLVLIGRLAWGKNKNIFDIIENRNDIKLLGYMDKEELIYIYNAALVFVSFSIYEGFGRILIEAMKCGIPVLCSDIKIYREIIGDAGKLVDLNNENEILQTLNEILNNLELRPYLIDKGFENIKKYDWQNAIKEIVSCYNNLHG